MQEKLITIKIFTYPMEAYLLVSKLESEGIKCFLENENTLTVHPFLSNAIGGVKLNIISSDLERAMKIIEQSETP